MGERRPGTPSWMRTSAVPQNAHVRHGRSGTTGEQDHSVIAPDLCVFAGNALTTCLTRVDTIAVQVSQSWRQESRCLQGQAPSEGDREDVFQASLLVSGRSLDGVS